MLIMNINESINPQRKYYIKVDAYTTPLIICKQPWTKKKTKQKPKIYLGHQTER